jgi:hypothetical protein
MQALVIPAIMALFGGLFLLGLMLFDRNPPGRRGSK